MEQREAHEARVIEFLPGQHRDEKGKVVVDGHRVWYMRDHLTELIDLANPRPDRAVTVEFLRSPPRGGEAVWDMTKGTDRRVAMWARAERKQLLKEKRGRETAASAEGLVSHPLPDVQASVGPPTPKKKKKRARA